MSADLHIVLYHPEIPQNTGNIGRLCVGLELQLHLVRPFSFDISDKAVRRAGLDYWRHVQLQVHEDEASFWRWAEGRRVHLFSSHGAAPHTAAPYQTGDVLVFGRESVGLPEELVQARGAWRIPMSGPIRSLNLSNAVAVVSYRALETVRPALFTGQA
ncbi:MAG: tRNA (cytidine(34)-2'-O)-methyltransferase [Deltaproteobacteria bacterium]|nr:tRNA (cytidine(34)-2'-O)-methyltransferase [Deltaproteobacteria bacterium]